MKYLNVFDNKSALDSSSREYSSRNEYFVTLGNGNINYNYKDGYRLVLGFLALEY